ncbi:MAG TPA: hypothetical protein VI078_16945 [bacterium]
MRTGAALRGAVVAAGLAFAARSDAADIASPHDEEKPRVCLNCHTEEIYAKACGGSEGYCLLAGSVDGLCLTCHIKAECCKPGLAHLPKLYVGSRSHPSDVPAAEIPRAYRPATLPLFNDRITCRTCHLHKRERPVGYKMLRLVTVSEKGVDWTPLCHDCHKDR